MYFCLCAHRLTSFLRSDHRAKCQIKTRQSRGIRAHFLCWYLTILIKCFQYYWTCLLGTVWGNFSPGVRWKLSVTLYLAWCVTIHHGTNASDATNLNTRPSVLIANAQWQELCSSPDLDSIKMHNIKTSFSQI